MEAFIVKNLNGEVKELSIDDIISIDSVYADDKVFYLYGEAYDLKTLKCKDNEDVCFIADTLEGESIEIDLQDLVCIGSVYADDKVFYLYGEAYDLKTLKCKDNEDLCFTADTLEGESIEIDLQDLICISTVYDDGIFYLYGELYNLKTLKYKSYVL